MKLIERAAVYGKIFARLNRVELPQFSTT